MFAGKLVPGHLSVQGAGLDGQMLTADIEIGPLIPSRDSISQVSDAVAAPGMTLRPVENPRVKNLSLRTPDAGPGAYPQQVRTSVIAVIDRHGILREVEVSSVRNYGQPLSVQQQGEIGSMAERMVIAVRRSRSDPPEIDGSPCQMYTRETMWGGSQRLN